jgi:hypothetical protein
MTVKPSFVKCPKCHATRRQGDARCWLCGDAIPSGDVVFAAVDENPYASPVAVENENLHGFSLGTMLLFVTLVCVVAGLFSIAPGLGVLAAIAVFIPFVRTALLVKARAARGRETPMTERVQLTALSAVVTLAMVALAGVVAIGVSAAAGDQLVLPVFFFGLLAAAIAVFYLFFLWARKRWRRDVGAK